MAFNINARINLSGPNNINSIVNQIQSRLRNINATVNLQISPNAISSLGTLNNQLITLNNTLRQVVANAQAFRNAINNINAGIGNLNTRLGSSSGSISAISRAISGITKSSQDGGDAIYKFGEQAGLATRRFLAFSLAAGSVVAFGIAIKQGIREAIQFERELVKLAQVSGDSREQIAGVAAEVTRLATTFGTSSKDLISAAVTLRQAGYSATETKQALEALAQAALSPNFDTMNKNVEGLIAIMSQFKLGTNDAVAALGSINAVAADFAVESKDILDAVTRAGGAFSSLGGNLNEFVAIFTSVRATTREGADAIATGLRTIFARLQRQDTLDALKQLRIELRYTADEARNLGDVNLAEQFVGPYEAIRRISEGLKGIQATDPRFAAITEQIGGYRQISRVLPLLQQTDVQDRALNTARGGTASLYASTERAQESLINKTQKVAESFQELFRTIASSEGFRSLVTVVLGLADGLSSVLKYAAPLIPLLTTLASIKIVSSLANFIPGFASTFLGGKGNPNYYDIRGYASGGYVGGVGNSDSEPALLPAGSFVMRKSAVQSLASGGISQLAKTDIVPTVISKPASKTRYQRKMSANAFLNRYSSTQEDPGISRLLNDVSLENFIGPDIYSETDFPQFNDFYASQGDKTRVIKMANGGTPLEIQNAIIAYQRDLGGPKAFKGAVYQANAKLGGQGLAALELSPEYKTKLELLYANIDSQAPFLKTKLSKNAYNAIRGHIFEGFIAEQAGINRGQNVAGSDLYGLKQEQLTKLQGMLSLNDYSSGQAVSLPFTLAGNFAADIKYTDIDKKRSETINQIVQRRREGFAFGGSSKDTIPAMLTPGEYVFSPEAVSRIGVPNLEYANKTGKLPGFNKGGFVQNFAVGGTAQPGASFYGANTQNRLAITDFFRLQTQAEGLTGQEQNKAVIARITKFRNTILAETETQAKITAIETEIIRRNIKGLEALELERQKELLIQGKKSLIQAAEVNVGKKGEVLGVGGVGTGVSGAQAVLGKGGTTEEQRLARVSTGLLAANLIIPYLNQGISSLAGTATKESTLGGYGAVRAGVGLLQGGALGGFVGQQASQTFGGKFSTALPVIGAILGAGTGIAEALQNVKKEILDAKIADSVSRFSSSLQAITTQIQQNAGAMNSEDLASASASLASTLDNVKEKAEENASHIYGLISGSFASVERNRISELRQQLGGSAGNIFNLLSQSARQIGARNPNATTENLRGQFLNANQGLNRTQIGLLAQLNNQSFEAILRQFNQDITRGQSQQRRQQAEGETSRLISSFGQLATAIESAAFDIGRFDNVLKSIYGFGTGQIGNIAPTGTSENLGSRLGTRSFEEIVQRSLNIFGNNQTAGGLGSTLSSLNQIVSVLPNILSKAFEGGLGGDSGTASSQVRRQLESRGFGGPNYEAIVNEIVTKIGQLDFNDLKKISADSVAFANQLTSAFNPLIEVVQRLTRAQEQQTASLLQGLDQYNKLIAQAAETRGRAAGLQFQGIRARAEFDVANQGGTVFSRITEAQTLEPFNQRQRFLTQGTGVANNLDPAELEQALRRAREEIVAASTGLSTARGFGQTREFADRLARANDQAARLQQAFANLADASTRNAYAQERLREIESERASRLSFAERYITGGPEGRQQVQRGFQLIQSVQQRGYDLNQGFGQEDANLIIRTLRELGTTQLPFAGGQQANDILQRILSQSAFGGQIQTNDMEAERTRLQNQVVATNLSAAQSLDRLASIQTSNANDFFTRLLANQTIFLQNLQLELQRVNVSQAQSNLDAVRARNQPLLTQQRNVNILSNLAGVTDQTSQRFLSGMAETTTQNQVNRLATIFQPLVDARRTIRDPGQLTSTLNAQQGSDLLSNLRTSEAFLMPAHTRNAAARDVSSSINRILQPLNLPEIIKPAIDESIRLNLRNLPQGASGIEVQNAIQKAITDGLLNISRQWQTGQGTQGTEVRNIQRFLNERLGSNFGTQLTRNAAAGNIGEISTAAQQLIQNNITSFERLNTNIGNVNTQLDSLRNILNGLNVEYSRNLESRPDFVGPTRAEVGMANGGQAIGTDTIPAMLSPGEFVVNPQSARANMGILRVINSTRRPVYMADGGIPAVRGGISGSETGFTRLTPAILQQLGMSLEELAGLTMNADPIRTNFIAQARQQLRSGPNIYGLSRSQYGDTLATLGSSISNPGGASAFLASGRGVNPFLSYQSQNVLTSQLAEHAGLGDQGSLIGQSLTDLNRQNLASLRQVGQLSSPAAVQNEINRSLAIRPANLLRQGILSSVTTPFGGIPGLIPGLFAPQRRNFASGGYVGTDTVPAMLSPGEFVFNSRATASIGAGNLAAAQRFAEGGLVGGAIPSGGNDSLVTAFNNFNNTASRFIEAMSAFPSSISLEGNHKVEIIINGADVLSNLQPEIRNLVSSATTNAINRMIRDRFPDVAPVTPGNNNNENPYNTI